FVAGVLQVVALCPALVDLPLVTLASIALLRGSMLGAVAGFWAGLLLDTATLGTLGFSSLLLTLAGFWIGRYGETTGRDRGHAPFTSVAVITVLTTVTALVLHYLPGEAAPARLVLIDTARNNQLRQIRVEAPRGPILDRYGRVLVTNTAGSSVQVWASDLPHRWPARRRELRALSRVVGIPVRDILRRLEKYKNDPLTPVTIERGIHRDQVDYLKERSNDFPGVRVADSFLRKYRYQALGAHVLGYVG